MKKIYINESQLLRENLGDSRAGTDFPCFYDEATDTWYEASWNGDYGFPFGFWYNGISEEFSIGDAWATHVNACGKVAKKYVEEASSEACYEDANTIYYSIGDLLDDFKQHGYTYNEEYDVYISADGSDEIDLDDWVSDLCDDLWVGRGFSSIVKKTISDGLQSTSIDDIRNDLQDSLMGELSFYECDDINYALEMVGSDFDSFFADGRNEGRIWPEKKMIGFYETEQPDPQTLYDIIQRLSQSDEIGVSYEDLLNFVMVFEDWRNDGVITACTLQNYMYGNYGPESYEDEEIQYARQGQTQFVPHLASPEEKREFFKDFRDTRDKAVYVPRERGAGNLAAYHAMRYPYGENKERRSDKIIKE